MFFEEYGWILCFYPKQIRAFKTTKRKKLSSNRFNSRRVLFFTKITNETPKSESKNMEVETRKNDLKDILLPLRLNYFTRIRNENYMDV